MGNEVFLHLVSDGVGYLARVDPRTDAKPGRKIKVLFDFSEVHAFDPETEQAIPLDQPV